MHEQAATEPDSSLKIGIGPKPVVGVLVRCSRRPVRTENQILQ
jgi:hypothetical protein